MAKSYLTFDWCTKIDSMPVAEKQKELVDLYVELSKIRDVMRKDTSIQEAKLDVDRFKTPYSWKTRQNAVDARKATDMDNPQELSLALTNEFENQTTMANDPELNQIISKLDDLTEPYNESIKELRERVNYIVDKLANPNT